MLATVLAPLGIISSRVTLSLLRIYGLPNIHKEGAPLTPIVNTIGGPNYLFTKYLVKKLKPLVSFTESFVKDCSSFVNELKGIKLDPGDILVSFDMVFL